MAYRFDPASGRKLWERPSEPPPGHVSAERSRAEGIERRRREQMEMLGHGPVRGVWNRGVEKPTPAPSRPVSAADAYAEMCRRMVKGG